VGPTEHTEYTERDRKMGAENDAKGGGGDGGERAKIKRKRKE